MTDKDLETILKQIDDKKLPPVHLWNPPLTGELDMRISIDGNWYYQGSVIERKSMVRLFSTVLKKESEDYFLVTPVEKYRITVEDAPFTAVEVDQLNNGQQILLFRTNVDTHVVADGKHPITIKTNPVTSEPRPYLLVRDGLNALISRNVFYQLVEWADQESIDGIVHAVTRSAGRTFILGPI